jgi:exodeoxyribonuclease VIII
VKLPAPGLYRNVPAEEYFAWEALDYSLLKELSRSPAHCYHAQTTPQKDTAARVLGQATHVAVLEPKEFSKVYAVAPTLDRRTTKGKATWKKWQEQNPNAIILRREDYNECMELSLAVQRNPLAASLIANATLREVSIVWKDEKTGFMCKSRIDLITEHGPWTYVLDFKTARSAAKFAFARDAARFRYHDQSAMYLTAADSVSPRQRRYGWIVAEKEPPYMTAVYELASEAIDQGYQNIRRYLDKYAECAKAGRWPGYGQEIQVISMPEWAMGEEEDG